MPRAVLRSERENPSCGVLGPIRSGGGGHGPPGVWVGGLVSVGTMSDGCGSGVGVVSAGGVSGGVLSRGGSSAREVSVGVVVSVVGGESAGGFGLEETPSRSPA